MALRLATGPNVMLPLTELSSPLEPEGGHRSSTACEIVPYIELFADDIVAYVVQDHVNGTPTDEARSALRAATENLGQRFSARSRAVAAKHEVPLKLQRARATATLTAPGRARPARAGARG